MVAFENGGKASEANYAKTCLDITHEQSFRQYIFLR